MTRLTSNSVILSGAERSRSRNAADAVGEAGLSIPWRYLKGNATGSLDFARDDSEA